MSAPDRQHFALQTIFSFFLGLMVLAFIGVGVNTFYPSPTTQHEKEQQAISRQIETIQATTQNKSLDATQQAQIRQLEDQQNALQDKIDAEMRDWARNTSIVLVIFATIVMGVSLVRSEELRVLSNGLLLGGLFTMLYGTGWVIFSGNSTARFVVIAFALVVAIALGYVKFVRGRAGHAAKPEPEAATPGDLADLTARVDALEERAAAAAAALGGSEKREA
jgi:Flp pilus assembly protein TadB